jgi:hypothetical protein
MANRSRTKVLQGSVVGTKLNVPFAGRLVRVKRRAFFNCLRECVICGYPHFFRNVP